MLDTSYWGSSSLNLRIRQGHEQIIWFTIKNFQITINSTSSIQGKIFIELTAKLICCAFSTSSWFKRELVSAVINHCSLFLKWSWWRSRTDGSCISISYFNVISKYDFMIKLALDLQHWDNFRIVLWNCHSNM